MIEAQGDLFTYSGATGICIPVNATLDRAGRAVMGAGLARALCDRYPQIDFRARLGKYLASSGNHVYQIATKDEIDAPFDVYSFPTKIDWRAASIPVLIQQSAIEARLIAGTVVLPRVGCGLGGLPWEYVRQILAPILNEDRFVVVAQ
jgi:hypothetical protein